MVGSALARLPRLVLHSKRLAAVSGRLTMGSSSSDGQHRNRLADQRSPYLLQHASDPVDWYAWGDEAFAKARADDALVFLSVGYSTCHWCHVMAHESFSREDVARVLAEERYVAVKVDREERPDVDALYMRFVRASSGGRGGWPMTVWLTPDLRPIAGATYLPREPLKRALREAAREWRERRPRIEAEGARALRFIRDEEAGGAGDLSKEVDLAALADACALRVITQYIGEHDAEWGGFGAAPKFPRVPLLSFLLHAYARDKRSPRGESCLRMCARTLRRMADGGIRDHVAGGFARYSTDVRWHVPHFEKTLYDQAQLAAAYADAYLATADAFFADVARDTLTFVDRDLSDPSGGFYAAIDADSLPSADSAEKREGAYYVLDYGRVRELFGDARATGSQGKSFSHFEAYCRHYDVREAGNVAPGTELEGDNVPIVLGSEKETAAAFDVSVDELRSILDECRRKLREERARRPYPDVDTKMVCSWNGLTISAFAKVGQALGDERCVERAVRGARFVRERLYDPASRVLLRARYRDEGEDAAGRSSNLIEGFLDDYAFLIKGLLDLYEASLDHDWLDWASLLQDRQDELFWDEKGHGYFTSADTSLVLRLKEDNDGAEPSGNSVSVHNLIRLAAYGVDGSDDRRKQRAELILMAFTSRLEMFPSALPEMVSALMFHVDSPTQVFIAGSRDDPRTLALLSVVRSRLLPGRIVAVSEPGTNGNTVLSRMKPLKGVPAAYVCRHFTCCLPVTEVSQLEELLDESHDA